MRSCFFRQIILFNVMLILWSLPHMGWGAVNIVAGTGFPGYTQDEVPATFAALKHPQAVLPMPDGSLYVADAGNRRIRWIDPQGAIHTVAGNGTAPVDALWNGVSLGFPAGLAWHPSGQVWIADAQAHRVFRLTPGSPLELVAGNGQEQPAVLASPEGTSLLYPVALQVIEGGMALSEMGSGRVLWLDENGSVSPGPGVWRAPYGLAEDVDGALLVTDFQTGQLSRISGDQVEVTATLLRPLIEGEAELSRLPAPTSAVVGRDGSLYIAVPDEEAVYRLSPEGEWSPFLVFPEVKRPVGLAVRAGTELLIADEGRHQVLSALLPYPAPLPGDPDADGSVTVNDAVIGLQRLLNLRPFNRREYLAVDVFPRHSEMGQSGDQDVTLEDALSILRRAVGLEPDPWP